MVTKKEIDFFDNLRINIYTLIKRAQILDDQLDS